MSKKEDEMNDDASAWESPDPEPTPKRNAYEDLLDFIQTEVARVYGSGAMFVVEPGPKGYISRTFTKKGDMADLVEPGHPTKHQAARALKKFLAKR